ncbi:NO-inducible flavohemoprotein [Kistimonas asteriae]|uniref:NO-inducible flavohemoprotein n=1 Tax=Kistimonas asteriae TaxID=517724 RepID=UPI001BA7F3EB|nr:NO-inducible flavohemoprotein [Kistimonas asteriae]
MLSSETIRIVQSTIPLLESAGTELTRYFYQRMLSHNPELKDVFNLNHQRSGGQPAALFEAVLGYARNIDNLSVLSAVVERIAQKHTSFLITPDQYQIVGYHLIETIRELAGEAATDEVLQAWTEAYQLLATIFIEREKVLYAEQEQAGGGWRGSRPFKVVCKSRESDLITSFYLEPVDGKPVMDFRPGQYLGIKLRPATSAYAEIRQYSLSDAPNGCSYRISVKRETGEVDGIMSNWLHDAVSEGDVIEVMPPAGDFFLSAEEETPVVLISAGVGLTPMLSMLNTQLQNGHHGSLFWLHACENGQVHAFADDIRAKEKQHERLKSRVWYNHPSTVDRPAEDYDFSGLMSLDKVRELIDVHGAHFYCCGPTPFVKMVNETLTDWGIEEDSIHYEIFGPHSSL